jgi:hypothetical protein
VIADREWADLVECLRHWWPGDFGDGAAEAYRLALGRFEAADVARVLAERLDAGERFRPSAGELVAPLIAEQRRRAALAAFHRRCVELGIPTGPALAPVRELGAGS